MRFVNLPAQSFARTGALRRNCAARVAKPTSAPSSEPAAEPLSLVPEPEPVKYTLKGPAGSPFTIGEGQLGAVLGASLAGLTRAGTGVFVAGYSGSLETAVDDEYAVVKSQGRMLKETSTTISTFRRPEKPIEIYEFDACPFCKKVREMCSYLDLDILYRPCPQGGPNFRPQAIEMGGKRSFPFMVDPNTGVSMYESDDIIAYLAKEYGNGEVPLMLRLGPATVLTAGLGSLGRAGKGARYRPSKMPAAPLIVWGYEPSPFSRLVKERLTELELPHIWRSTARGSPKREEMFKEWGKFQVPFLQDPNTGVAMFESAAIIEYLEETYAIKA